MLWHATRLGHMPTQQPKVGRYREVQLPGLSCIERCLANTIEFAILATDERVHTYRI
jgi:hypothetical protein